MPACNMLIAFTITGFI